MRVPWIARRSNQSILKEISPGCSLEGLILKLKFQYFGHLMRRANSLKKNLMLGKMEGRKRKEQQKYLRWLDGITDSMDMNLSKLLEKEMATHSNTLAWETPWTGAWWATVHGVVKNWTGLKWLSTTEHRRILPKRMLS